MHCEQAIIFLGNINETNMMMHLTEGFYLNFCCVNLLEDVSSILYLLLFARLRLNGAVLSELSYHPIN